MTFTCGGRLTVRRMSDDTWDLVVIGTGGAAMAAGIEARSRGKRVLLVEHGRLGGTCLTIGCVPSKNLLAAAGQRHRAISNKLFPMVPTGADGTDLPALMRQKQDLIDDLRQAKYADVADAHGSPIRYGHARFIGRTRWRWTASLSSAAPTSSRRASRRTCRTCPALTPCSG